MRRPLIPVGSAIMDWNLMQPAQDAMTALAKFAAAIIGTTGSANGLPCTQTTVPSMQVMIGTGELYQMASLEATALGTLPVNTTDMVLKQGLLMASDGPVSLPQSSVFSTPAAAGQSINYLIEAQYQDQDISLDPTTGNTNIVLNFYDAANPSVPYSGPNNTGAASNTFRKGAIAFQVKSGTSATTGSQTTPTPDSGWIGLYVVTVAYGASTILNSNITTYPGAPFLSPALLGSSGGAGGYAPINSPALVGSPTVPTPPQFDASFLIADTAFVQRALGAVAGVAQINTTTALTAALANYLILCGGSGSTFILPPLSSVKVGTKVFFASQGGSNSLNPNGTDALLFGSTTVANQAFGGTDTVEITASTAGWNISGGSVLLAASATFQAARFGYVNQQSINVPASSGGVPGALTQTLSFTPTMNGILQVVAIANEGATAMGQQLYINAVLVCADVATPCSHVWEADVTAGTTYSIQQVVKNGNSVSEPTSVYLAYLFVPGH